MENITIEQNNIKPHPILAGVIDFYCLSIFFTFIISVLSSIIGSSIIGDYQIYKPFVLLLIVLFIDVLYCSVISKKTKILSPGEYLSGKRIVDHKKVWTNPYNGNRFGVFMIIMINIILLGNEFESGMAGQLYSLSELFIKLTRVLFYLYLMRLLSENNKNGFNLLIFASVLLTYSLFSINNLILFRFNLGLTVLYVIIFLIYSKRNMNSIKRLKDSLEQES